VDLYLAISVTFLAGGAGAVIAQVHGADAETAVVAPILSGFGAGTGLPVRIAATHTRAGTLVAIRELTSTIRLAR
jgi:hypothetical protein